MHHESKIGHGLDIDYDLTIDPDLCTLSDLEPGSTHSLIYCFRPG